MVGNSGVASKNEWWRFISKWKQQRQKRCTSRSISSLCFPLFMIETIETKWMPSFSLPVPLNFDQLPHSTVAGAVNVPIFNAIYRALTSTATLKRNKTEMTHERMKATIQGLDPGDLEFSFLFFRIESSVGLSRGATPLSSSVIGWLTDFSLIIFVGCLLLEVFFEDWKNKGWKLQVNILLGAFLLCYSWVLFVSPGFDSRVRVFLCGVTPVSVWVFSGHSGFLPQRHYRLGEL